MNKGRWLGAGGLAKEKRLHGGHFIENEKNGHVNWRKKGPQSHAAHPHPLEGSDPPCESISPGHHSISQNESFGACENKIGK